MTKEKGITLIALVITIIVLLILAGVSIATLTGENGILVKVSKAKEENKRESAKEQINLTVMSSLDNDGKFNRDKFKEEIVKIGGTIVSEDEDTIVVELDSYQATIDAKTGKIISFEELGEEEIPDTPVEFSMAYGRIEVVWLDINDQIIEKPNQPNLGNMTPIKWDGITEKITTSDDASWYDYKAKKGTEENLESHWANAKNGDSYFVWIPRYAYRITYYASQTSNQVTGYCDGEGTREVNGNVRQPISPTAKIVEKYGKKYIVHPAFRDGTSNHFKNGEWDKELEGIWVGKYEASHSDATANSVGSSDTLKVVPGVPSWITITMRDIYTKAYQYDREKESHMMKNSEWGAVAYLTHSQYGRNGYEIDINNSTSYITGNGSGSTIPNPTAGITHAYNTEVGAKASSTGNIYGIYDLSGGAWERVAGYITNGNSVLSNGSSFVAKTTADGEGYKTLSTKYATVYPYNTSSDSYQNNFITYKNIGYGHGDAILEIATTGRGHDAWFNNRTDFLSSSDVFFMRGGGSIYTDGTGLYAFTCNGGGPYIMSFRPVLVF